MKIILLKNINKLGKKDDIVDVAQGFAQNSLFPKKLAILATDNSIELLNKSKKNKEIEKKIKHNLLDQAIKNLDGKEVLYQVRSNKEGSLFSKINSLDIAKFLEDKYRILIDPECIILPEKNPIKKIGDYKITIRDEDYSGEIRLIIK